MRTVEISKFKEQGFGKLVFELRELGLTPLLDSCREEHVKLLIDIETTSEYAEAVKRLILRWDANSCEIITK